MDRLNLAADERNQAVWADVLRRGRKAKVCWTINPQRWKDALFSGLR